MVKINTALKPARSKKIKACEILKTGFLNKTVDLDLSDRTMVVQFFMNIFQEKKYSKGEIVAISMYLKRKRLSRCERVAILTHLGYTCTKTQRALQNLSINNSYFHLTKKRAIEIIRSQKLMMKKLVKPNEFENTSSS